MDFDQINPNIRCHICGENEFEQREGFYYCLECGVKQEQVRQVEVENVDEFDDTTGLKKQARTIKINTTKVEKPQLTSWECYNYILRGFVDELLKMGAKEDLKLMALQVWATYLRCNEVAFFNKKHAELPKLGVRYLKNDAATIYNHSILAHKKRKRIRNGSEAASCASGGEDMSKKEWSKSKRKLDESLYSSFNSLTSASQLSISTGSGITNRAIKLNYNMRARKYLKKIMNVGHLNRHEKDTEGLLQCHNQPKATEVGRAYNLLTVMSIKQIYAILGIALNLIEDDIQLCDLVRFIYEGHIGWKNVLLYFPENIAGHGKELLKNINFYSYAEKYTENFMREHINRLCYKIKIHGFKLPNMIALVQRYVNELCLPSDIATYAERLINFMPPRCQERSKHNMPNFEARAMAYIVFILKLLFGLDGEKEHRMSREAQKLNEKIQNFNRQFGDNRPQLFVWNEWVQYIEMRTKIISQYNTTYCRQFRQRESSLQIMEEMSYNICKRDEEQQTQNENNENPYYKKEFDTFRSLLSSIMEQKTNNDATEIPQPVLEFKHTLTPGLSYFKKILLHYDNVGNSTLKIPEFMRVNHSDRDMLSYIEVKPLVEYFHKHQCELKVYNLDITENRKFVGIFRSGVPAISKAKQKANFDCTEEDWHKIIQKRSLFGAEQLDWKTEFELFEEKSFNSRVNRLKRNDRKGSQFEQEDEENGHSKSANILSIEVFNENNMEPIQGEDAPTKPRRNLNTYNIFENIDEENSLVNSVSELNRSSSTTPDVSAANDDNFGKSLGITIKSEFIEESPQKAANAEKHKYKFYISSMDCWMIMGKIPSLNKTHHNELLDRFPAVFKWLIEMCAHTLGTKWIYVYEQLLAIEIMFGLGVEDLDKVENCLHLSYLHPNKDFQALVSRYREMW